MKIKEIEINGLRCFYREGTSDIKTFEEVIFRNVYEKRGNKIQAGEQWFDCGANVGAFSLLVNKRGGEVEIFEPDPFNCEMIEKNLKANGFKSKVNQVALLHNNQKKANLYSGKNGNYWRNSLLKNWDNKGLKVPCVNFDQATKDGFCVKMDIEGCEMPIIETTKRKFKKLIFEWSFDIDPDLTRYWRVIEKLEKIYQVKASKYEGKGVTVWPPQWFPPCTNVFCYEKNLP